MSIELCACRECLCGGGVRMYHAPVACNVNAAAEPDALEATHIVEEFYQASGACRATDQAVMQANRQQPGVFCTLLIQQVKGIPQVLKEVVSLGKAVALIAAVVV